jgi:hypothetical protein
LPVSLYRVFHHTRHYVGETIVVTHYQRRDLIELEDWFFAEEFVCL